jgi:aspartate 4-decarboxylase
MPRPEGIAQRLREFLGHGPKNRASVLLERSLDYAQAELRFDPDAFVHELANSVVGDNYPVPDRMLVHAERVVHDFLVKEMCAGRAPPAGFDLFATEGGTAAMCYTFDALVQNRVLHKGDTIAIGTPIFTPYLEITNLAEFQFETIHVEQSEMKGGVHTWQYPAAEIAKLEDPRIKALFLVHPSNPASFAMRRETMDQIAEIVRTKNRDLIILTDDVYGTFVDGFESLASILPENTILVYSFSKHFGCTGWRLGVVALHRENVIDRAIARLPEVDKKALRERYSPIALQPDTVKFIDRMVAESRMIALNHTAGLSLPQQVQMTLFSLFALLDEGDAFKKRVRRIVRERLASLAKGLDVDVPPDPLRAAYYVDLDFAAWGRRTIGEEFQEYLDKHRSPLEIVLALAKKRGTVLLSGGGFDAPPWSVRVSLANLDSEAYERIGEDLADVARAAVDAWRRSKKQR